MSSETIAEKIASGELKASVSQSFNAAAERFLGDIVALFPKDVVATLMKDELLKYAMNPESAEIPALLFAKALSNMIVLAGDPETKRTSAMTLIMQRDERLLTNADRLGIKMFSSINLAEKFEKISRENKDALWDRMENLVTLSSAVVIASAAAAASGAGQPLDDIVSAVAEDLKSEGGKEGQQSGGDHKDHVGHQHQQQGHVDVNKTAKEVARRVMQDPKVRNACVAAWGVVGDCPDLATEKTMAKPKTTISVASEAEVTKEFDGFANVSKRETDALAQEYKRLGIRVGTPVTSLSKSQMEALRARVNARRQASAAEVETREGKKGGGEGGKELSEKSASGVGKTAVKGGATTGTGSGNVTAGGSASAGVAGAAGRAVSAAGAAAVVTRPGTPIVAGSSGVSAGSPVGGVCGGVCGAGAACVSGVSAAGAVGAAGAVSAASSASKGGVTENGSGPQSGGHGGGQRGDHVFLKPSMPVRGMYGKRR